MNRLKYHTKICYQLSKKSACFKWNHHQFEIDKAILKFRLTKRDNRSDLRVRTDPNYRKESLLKSLFMVNSICLIRETALF